jgi:hypothetical protein
VGGVPPRPGLPHHFGHPLAHHGDADVGGGGGAVTDGGAESELERRGGVMLREEMTGGGEGEVAAGMAARGVLPNKKGVQ